MPRGVPMTSCSPGSTTSGALSVPSICFAVSNCAGLERWVTSPVWTTNAGCTGIALIASMVF